MLETDVEEELHERLIKFTKQHSQIKALYKGTSPEYPNEGSEIVYWFLTGSGSKYDNKLEDEITELDLELVNNILSEVENIDLMTWPTNPEDAANYGFIGECIYKK